jgi:hypothetical protein
MAGSLIREADSRRERRRGKTHQTPMNLQAHKLESKDRVEETVSATSPSGKYGRFSET